MLSPRQTDPTLLKRTTHPRKAKEDWSCSPDSHQHALCLSRDLRRACRRVPLRNSAHAPKHRCLRPRKAVFWRITSTTACLTTTPLGRPTDSDSFLNAPAHIQHDTSHSTALGPGHCFVAVGGRIQRQFFFLFLKPASNFGALYLNAPTNAWLLRHEALYSACLQRLNNIKPAMQSLHNHLPL